MYSIDTKPLASMLYKDTIALNVKANDWEEAVREAGKLLVNSGAVQPR